jgi:putative zinc finger protein
MVNCREALELMGEYVDGELGIWSRWRLRLHLWICRICRRYLSSYRATIRIAKSTREGLVDDVDDQIPDALTAQFLKAARRR